MTENNASDTTVSLAVELGRVQEGQAHILDAIKGLRDDFKSTAQTIDNHSERITRVEDRTDALEKGIEEANRRRPPWTAIGALIIAAAVAAKQFVGF